MRKIKKSLAVLLAVIMLATFMPLFASAATITLNANNVIILEAPKISYGDQIEVSKITANYGVKTSDLTVTGGKLGYVASEGATPVEVPGTFSATSTLKLAVGENTAIRLKFTPDDTATYSSPTVSALTYTMAEGVVWPSAHIIGQTTILVEAPTASGILANQQLSFSSLSGGKVTDADGVELTGGRWRFVDTSLYPTASGDYEVQWTKTGYATIKTTVYVEVTSYGEATLVENPIAKRLQVGSTLGNTTFVGGKVFDKDGNEVTTGYWRVIIDENQANVTYDTEGTYNIRVMWSGAGYTNTLEATIPLTVADGKGYEVTVAPTLDNNRFIIDKTMTYADLVVTPGEATVPGRWYIQESQLNTEIPTTAKKYTAKVYFQPDDLSYYATGFDIEFRVLKYNAWEIPESFVKVTVPYGVAARSVSFSERNYPEVYAAGINSMSWKNTDPDFKPEELEPGDIRKVKVKYFTSNYQWEDREGEIYVQIEPRVYENDFCTINVMNPDNITGDTAVTIHCDIPGITGEVQVKANGETFATLKPDEKGYIHETLNYVIKADGEYTFSATYIPSILDKTTVTVTEVTGRTVNADIIAKRHLTVYVANQKFEYDVYETHGVYHSWADFSSEPHADVFDHWVVTDGNGNEVTVENLDPQKPHLQFVMPEHDLVLTAKGEIEDMTASDGSLGSTLWSFWEKLINFIIEIYRTIDNLFHIG